MKTPLKVCYSESNHIYIKGSDNKSVCSFISSNRDKSEANAAHIVKCVNLHDDLINVIEQLDFILTAVVTNEKVNLKEVAPSVYEAAIIRLKNSVSVLKREKGDE